MFERDEINKRQKLRSFEIFKSQTDWFLFRERTKQHVFKSQYVSAHLKSSKHREKSRKEIFILRENKRESHEVSLTRVYTAQREIKKEGRRELEVCGCINRPWLLLLLRILQRCASELSGSRCGASVRSGGAYLTRSFLARGKGNVDIIRRGEEEKEKEKKKRAEEEERAQSRSCR